MTAPQDLRQGSQYLSITTTAGDGVLQLSRIHGREAMSETFAYELELYANGDGPACADLIGTEAAASIKASDGSIRYIHGVLTESALPVPGPTPAAPSSAPGWSRSWRCWTSPAIVASSRRCR
ncbi:hypothetical protein ACFQU2_03365 [Siccirubricoccus deserti]